MMMIKKLYYFLYRLTASAEEKGEYSGGYFQGVIRRNVLALCEGMHGRTLEIGCGSGLFLTKLAQQNKDLQIWSIDNESTMVSCAKKKCEEKNLTNIHIMCQDARRLCFEDGYFDAVVCINFILMMDSIESVRDIVTQMGRVCKKGGKIIFEFRNASNVFFAAKYKLARYYDGTITHPLQCYRITQIASILDSVDLAIVRKINLGSFLFGYPAPIIVIEAEKR